MTLVQLTIIKLLVDTVYGVQEFMKIKAVTRLTIVTATGRNFRRITASLTLIISLSQKLKAPVILKT